MKYIELTQGKKALVDDEDFEYLNQWNWYAYKDTKTKFYARRTFNFSINGKNTGRTILMHSLICKPSKGKMVDHINHDTLDNRRENLREATHFQNTANCKIYRSNTSKVKGVIWRRDLQKWCARLSYHNKRIYLGVFKEKILALEAYNMAAKKYFKEFALLNN